MLNQFLKNKEKEFDEKFGDNFVWWQECIAEMRIGDPDFNRLKQFLHQSHIELINEVKKICSDNLHTVYTGEYKDGYNQAIFDIISKLSEHENNI